ncbi:MAG TPA: GntR family transcriptional regulator [Chloroflexota bacterium]|nr:GntR family transcriptional regulator [Chloroflexota bacterium]
MADLDQHKDGGPAEATAALLRPMPNGQHAGGALARDANFKFIVYRTLRKAIVEGRLTPGARLVEATLASQFGISKTPVREALVMLQAEDLVTMRPHHGYWVRHLSLGEFAEALFLLDAVEFAALDRALIEMTPEQLETARALAATMEAAVPDQDIDTYRQAQRSLHQLIHVPHGYQLLADTVQRLMDITDRYHRLTIAARPEQLSLDMARTWARISAMGTGNSQELIRFIRGSHETLINTLREAVAANQGGIAALFVADESTAGDAWSPPLAIAGQAERA